ncbi:hypothetical protein BDZ89DRAFT_986009 [Hymenopellis radicata]|nr:hypothetical protein BDZ89DRAFT_986009 [Hymenopellis radicata]
MSKQRIRSPSVEVISDTPAILSSRSPNVPQPTAGASTNKKRKSTSGPAEASSSKRAKTTSAPAPAAPQDRWKWINLCKPEIEMKGTKIEVSNCGGTYFKTTAKTLEMRLDKLEAFFNECDGDESGHPHYGYPELCKPKVKARKEDAEVDRWTWVNKCRPEIRMKRTAIEAYNCGGCYFRATGKTIEDRLDKMEKFFNECAGDETRHPSYGSF